MIHWAPRRVHRSIMVHLPFAEVSTHLQWTAETGRNHGFSCHETWGKRWENDDWLNWLVDF